MLQKLRALVAPLSLAGFASFLTGGCSTVQGEEIGTYKVELRLVENTCGPEALYTVDGKRFKVQLRAEGETGFWRVGGEKPLQGSYKAGHFEFTYASIVATSADDAATFCQLQQSEVLSGAVDIPGDAGVGDASADAGSTADKDAGTLPESGLLGQLVFTISPVSGTDCQDALPPVGKYQKLPCQVRYELTGTPAESF